MIKYLWNLDYHQCFRFLSHVISFENYMHKNKIMRITSEILIIKTSWISHNMKLLRLLRTFKQKLLFQTMLYQSRMYVHLYAENITFFQTCSKMFTWLSKPSKWTLYLTNLGIQLMPQHKSMTPHDMTRINRFTENYYIKKSPW